VEVLQASARWDDAGALVPEADDRAIVHRVIYEELIHGRVTASSRAAYRTIVARLVERGVDGVIAGCTEIELLLGPADVPVAYYPTTSLHAAAVAEWVLADE
jgi:aspartate racemase